MYVREAALVASCSRWVAACWWIGAPASPAGARTIHGRYSVERIELRPMRAMLREACTFGNWLDPWGVVASRPSRVVSSVC
jgi:hypothetical protein